MVPQVFVCSVVIGNTKSALWKAWKHHLGQCLAASSDCTKKLDPVSAPFGDSDTVIY